MYVAVTGYYGTGSSAVIDLLREYSEFSEGKLNKYEHIPFYTPNGLFDLEDKLLYGNNLHRSDEALSSFLIEMERLNINNFGWFGGYHQRYGDQFNKMTREFIDNIQQFETRGNWSYTYKKMKKSVVQYGIDIIRTLLGKETQRNFGEKTVYNPKHVIRSSFITEEEFFLAGRAFIKGYLEMIGGDAKNTVFDHLLLPHNLFRIRNYFDDDFKVIVVERDVRDLFVLSKYVWPSMGASAPLPKDVNQFASFWSKMRALERKSDNANVLRIYFEDLIYKYDETVTIIEGFLNIDKKDHINTRKEFIPEKSIKNTQNYKINNEWEKEVEVLERELSDYIYNFPFAITTSIQEVFD